MLIRVERSCLLVIDIQEKLLGAMHDGDVVTRNAGILLQAAARMDVPVLASEQYPQGLGPTVDAVAEHFPDASGPPERRTLPRPPTVTGPLEGPLGATDELSWTAQLGAQRYRIELARDAQFTYGLLTLGAEGTSLTPGSRLAPGRWYWRVAAVDEDGFVGAPSRVYSFGASSGDGDTQ